MRWLVAVLILCAAWTQPAPAQTPAERQSIQTVIAGQIDAFRRDDGAAAFAFASPDVQAIFRTEERFMAMVRQGYQPVYRPKSVTFGTVTAEGEHLVQRVEVIGPGGQPYLALYYMISGADGAWLVDGCELTDSDGVGT
jgi:hypothetical protein